MRRLMLAFFASGFAALLCQVAWQRMLGIFAGSDTVSAALVVGAFLMGLGLGSLAGARLADRLSPARALLGFALCEAGVAVFALLSKPFLYDFLAIRLAGVVDAPAAIFALCFAGLVLPTTLMGASLPLLSRAVATSLDTVAERVGRLYGMNTVGAGLGALLGGWRIIGALGFPGTLVLAAALELFAAGVALTLLPALRRLPSAPQPVAVRREAATAAAAFRFGGLPLWCGLVFLSGFVIVALEILWVRLLGQVGQFHAYLFPTVLGVFLLADGLGMAVATRHATRTRDPRRPFFLLQGGGFVLALGLILALWVGIGHPPLAPELTVNRDRTTLWPLLATAGLTGLVVGPPAFLIGMTFPYVQRAVQQDLALVGSRVGWVQFANIAGNAAGSVGTGLVALHLLGTAGSLRLLALLSLLLLLGWLWRAGRGGGWRRLWPEWGLAGACALGVLALPGNAGFWRRMHAHDGATPAIWAEDRSGVAYFRGERGVPSGQARGPLFIAGHGQGTIPFLPIHMLLGATGPLLHPDPQRILVVGVGSGGTPWGALANPAMRELRGVELVRPVLGTLAEVARHLPGGAVGALHADPRVRLEHGDGRRALAQGEDRYDVIEADAILPTTSNSGLLYSREFLDLVRHRLAPGGLAVQWAPTERVVETFTAVFPHVLLLQPANILVGSDRPIPLGSAGLAARLREAGVLAHLRRGNPDPAALAQVLDLVSDPPLSWGPGDPRGGDLLTDMAPRDEFFANNGRRPRPGRPSRPPPEPAIGQEARASGTASAP